MLRSKKNEEDAIVYDLQQLYQHPSVCLHLALSVNWLNYYGFLKPGYLRDQPRLVCHNLQMRPINQKNNVLEKEYILEQTDKMQIRRYFKSCYQQQ